MATLIVRTAHVGDLGIDTDTKLNLQSASKLRQAGFDFVLRYLSRGSPGSPADLDAAEALAIGAAGLDIGAVQHVRAPGWAPTAAMGTADGAAAAHNAMVAHLPPGMTLWLDLEGMAGTADDAVAFANAWHDAVSSFGYATGVYVGAGVPLDGDALYKRLHTHAYWRSQSQVPNVTARGYCLIQLFDSQVVAGVTVDIDVVQKDFLGGLPRFAHALASGAFQAVTPDAPDDGGDGDAAAE